MLRYFKKHMIVRLIRKCVSCLLWKKIGIIIICSYIYTIIIFNIFGKLDENYIFHISSVFVVFIDFRLIIFLGFSPLYKYKYIYLIYISKLSPKKSNFVLLYNYMIKIEIKIEIEMGRFSINFLSISPSSDEYKILIYFFLLN